MKDSDDMLKSVITRIRKIKQKASDPTKIFLDVTKGDLLEVAYIAYLQEVGIVKKLTGVNLRYCNDLKEEVFLKEG